MKLHIKEQLRKIAYPKTTNLKRHSQSVKTKGAPKEVKLTQDENSTKQSPSYFEHVDSYFPNSPTPKSQKSVEKGAHISKPPPPPPILGIEFIDKMLLFMHKHIKQIVDVKDDGICGFWDVSRLLGKGESHHQFVRVALLKELTTRGEFYMKLYGAKKIHSIQDALVPCVGSNAPFAKWMHFPEMGHLIASAYDRVCIDVTRFGFSETFFPLRSGPPKDPPRRFMYIGWLSKSLHFVVVYLKPECPIPATSLEWTTHSTTEAEIWPDQFLERMEEFTRLSELERESNQEKSKAKPIVDLSGAGAFDAF